MGDAIDRCIVSLPDVNTPATVAVQWWSRWNKEGEREGRMHGVHRENGRRVK